MTKKERKKMAKKTTNRKKWQKKIKEAKCNLKLVLK